MKYFGHLPLEKRLIGTSLRPTHFSINESYLWITGTTWLVTCQLRYSCLVREGRDILSFIETGERSTRKEKRHKNDGKYYFLKLISFLLSLVTCKYVSFIFLYMYMYIYVSGWLQVNVKVCLQLDNAQGRRTHIQLYDICLFISLLSFRMACILTFWHFTPSGDEIYWTVHNITLTYFTFFSSFTRDYPMLCVQHG